MTDFDVELPIASLPDRYGVARSQVYTRLDALKQRDPSLTPLKRNRKAYANARLITALDAMHTFIQQGDTVVQAAKKALDLPLIGPDNPDDVERPENPVSPVSPVGLSYRTQDSSLVPTSDRPSDLARLADVLEARQSPPDLLNRYRALEEIAANGWELSTSEIAQLLGLKTLSGKEFKRHGFKFTRVGKVGTQSGWKVEKL